MNNSHLTARPAFCAASTVLGRAWPLPTQKPERRVRCPELGTGDAVTLREDSCHLLVLQTRGGFPPKRFPDRTPVRPAPPPTPGLRALGGTRVRLPPAFSLPCFGVFASTDSIVV